MIKVKISRGTPLKMLNIFIRKSNQTMKTAKQINHQVHFSLFTPCFPRNLTLFG
jgi:hypothetical protein